MKPTVGIDFLAKNTIYKGKQFRLQLWDTAGQERFKSLIPSYLKDAVGAIIVYDVSNKQSLVDAQKWMKLYNENKSVEGYMILVGNKIDLPYRYGDGWKLGRYRVKKERRLLRSCSWNTSRCRPRQGKTSRLSSNI